MSSTIDSFNNGEVTLLAIIETLLAMSITLVLAVVYSPSYFVLCVLIAPILLLRTPESVSLGLKIADAWNGKLFDFANEFANKDDDESQYKSTIAIIMVVFISPVIAFASKIGASIRAVFLHPVLSIKAIPDNWKKQALCLDLMHPPEPIPGMEISEDVRVIKFEKIRSFYSQIFYPSTESDKCLKCRTIKFLTITPLLLLYFVPAWLYRWSVKSTAWIYSPFIWIVSSSFSSNLSMKGILSDIRTSEIGRISLIYSFFVIIVFSSKLIVINYSYQFESIFSQDLISPFFETSYKEIPRWQLVIVFNSILAWGLFFLAGRQLELLKLRDESCEPKIWVSRVVHFVIFVRSALTIYYILPISIYFLISNIEQWNIPQIGENWFPIIE